MVVAWIITHYKERDIEFEDMSVRYHFNFHMSADVSGIEVKNQDLPVIIQAEAEAAQGTGPIEKLDH